MDMGSGLATCSSCAHQFAIDEILNEDPLRRPEIVMPKGVEVLKMRKTLEIVVDWYHATPKRGILSLVTGSFFWNLLLMPLLLWMALLGHFLLIVFFSGHLITGAMLLIYLLAKLVNKTSITVERAGIKISHSPIKTPLNKAQFLPVEEIDQLYVSRYTEKLDRKSKQGVQAYALSAVMKNRQQVTLVRGMSKETQLYLEQEIEKYLDIKDRKVSGEVSRPK